MNPFILSIDAGTTGITVLLIKTDGTILDKYYKEFKQYYPNPGWVEHDPNEIWDTTLYLIHKAFKFHESKACLTIGITNQRETTLIWNKITGKPIYNAIVWQCKRTQKNCLELKKSRQNNIIKNKHNGT